MVSRKVLVASMLFFLPVFAGPFTFTSQNCVDPAGFDTCWSNANQQANSLSAKYCSGSCTDAENCVSADPNCGASVICVAYQSWLNCALGHCWNRVYGCEYQNLAISAIENCPIADTFPPYIPAPKQAPGYCSCNMGFVFYTFKESQTEYSNCIASVGKSQTLTTGGCYPNCYKDSTICDCCAASTSLSTFYNSCPNTAPAQLPFFSKLGYSDLQSSNCKTNLTDPATCSNSLFGFDIRAGPENGTDTMYLANNLPASGTQSISNNPGFLASPTGSATFTWSLIKGAPQTVTAVMTGNVAAASSSVRAAGGSSSITSAAAGAASSSVVAAGGGVAAGSGSTTSVPAGSSSSAAAAAPASTTAKAAMGGRIDSNAMAAFVVVVVAVAVIVN